MASSGQSIAKGEGEAAAESGEREPSDSLPFDELGHELTDREAMSLVNANVAIPINAAVAASVLSDPGNSVACADAEQEVGDIDRAN